MLATLTILDSSVASRAAVVVPEFRGCGRQERVADSADGRRPLCGELAGRCLAMWLDGMKIPAFVAALANEPAG